MTRPARISPRVMITIVIVSLTVAVVTIDQRRRDAVRTNAELLDRIQQLETTPQ